MRRRLRGPARPAAGTGTPGLAQVVDRARAGQDPGRIARELGLPLDLVVAALDHWARTQGVTVLALGPAGRGSGARGVDPAGCAPSAACAGCFFARACPSR